MTTIYLDPHQVPAIFAGVFSDYKGRKFKTEIVTQVECIGMQWDGGTRYEYAALNLTTGESRRITDPRPWPANMSGGPTVDLKTNAAIVKHTIFQGKDLGLTFYIHPDNAPQYLPEPDGVSEDECIVLAYTAALKSTNRGIKNLRFHEASRNTGITQERWDNAINGLISTGHLRKNKSITPKGRNVNTGIKVY